MLKKQAAHMYTLLKFYPDGVCYILLSRKKLVTVIPHRRRKVLNIGEGRGGWRAGGGARFRILAGQGRWQTFRWL